jgi:hypothetical protein
MMMTNPYYELLPAKEVPPNEVDSFLVCGMFTKNYGDKALKLEASLNKFRMPYALYEIPSIHSSISHHGSASSPFNKPEFIRAMLDKYKLPILYLDVDCEIERNPTLITQIIHKGKDFGIFNWLSRERNDAYGPVNLPDYENNRFYTYTHGINLIDETQLRCSGAVQFWGNTQLAKNLLAKWNQTVEENPNAADDISLDFAYNNNVERALIRPFWLPKSYARYAFWIFDKPTINHPDMPNEGAQFQKIKLKEGQVLVNERGLQRRLEIFYIPPNMFLDRLKNEVVAFQFGIPVRIKRNALLTYIGRN